MTVLARDTTPVILIDIGGVLSPDHLPAAAARWSGRLGISQQDFLGALFGGNDEWILIGRTSQEDWWRTIRGRLRISGELLSEIRRDLAAGQRWDAELVAGLRDLRGAARTVIVSNAWPEMRGGLPGSGVLDAVHDVVLSCDAGCAKPDPRIYAIALERAAAATPAQALFIDDTEGHVRAARSLGLAGHVHRDTASTLARITAFVRAAPRG
ncbi:HAD-IA family hydrolase [Streptomyces sp. GS7]|uniref:HAD-IA family hydrolase n=1 Tax=Streptomyces sp. GS7 TaxID=2692234 RepID=UPI001317F081|nr:HAD-IA family hydrolase [Streptomyces sp. GS7]QHC23083.1 HAD-IA family hydrolase [Streptomyces sp. GS7]